MKPAKLTAKHNHKVRTTGKNPPEIILEPDCPRCKQILALLRER